MPGIASIPADTGMRSLESSTALIGWRPRVSSPSIGARFRPGDPLAFSGRHRGRAVEAAGDLEPDERQAPLYPAEETCIQCLRRFLHQTASYRNAGGLERSPAVTADRGKRILHGYDDLADAGLDKGGRTGWRLAFVRAGFQCQVGRRATCPGARSPESVDFGMRFARNLVPAFANNLAVPDHDATHHRIRMSGVNTPRRETQGTRHECAVRGREFSHQALPVLLAQQLGQQ
jgi:endonuclease YncB( thermonuclease family)